MRQWLTIIFLSISTHALNLYPLPDSFVTMVYVAPIVGFQQIKTTTIDQQDHSTTAQTRGLRVNWGAPIHGWGVEWQQLTNQYGQVDDTTIVDTALSSTILNLRRQYAIYSGEMGHLAVGGSIGYAYSRYVMHAYKLMA